MKFKWLLPLDKFPIIVRLVLKNQNILGNCPAYFYINTATTNFCNCKIF